MSIPRVLFLPTGGDGVSGSQVGNLPMIRVTVTNGAKRIYVDWPDGRLREYEVPSTGVVEIEFPVGMTSGVVTVTDMRIPDPSDDRFQITTR